MAAIRADFIFRTLKILQKDLAELDIPLHVEIVDPRKGIPRKIVELMKEWQATELFSNLEYEIDELDRDKMLISEAETSNICITYCHDQCVVEPGTIMSGVFPESSSLADFYSQGDQCQSILPFYENGFLKFRTIALT